MFRDAVRPSQALRGTRPMDHVHVVCSDRDWRGELHGAVDGHVRLKIFRGPALVVLEPTPVGERALTSSRFYDLLFRREWPYFLAFDALAIDGEDLRALPLVERKRRLARIMPRVEPRLLLPDSNSRPWRASVRTRLRARSRGHRGEVGKRLISMRRSRYFVAEDQESGLQAGSRPTRTVRRSTPTAASSPSKQRRCASPRVSLIFLNNRSTRALGCSRRVPYWTDARPNPTYEHWCERRDSNSPALASGSPQAFY
jgi:hypothetical protein